MKQLLAVSVLILLPPLVWGQQNLVPNHSFEDVEDCPSAPGFWEIIDWSNGNGLSPDNYNSCAPHTTISFSASVPTNYVGFQEAYDGEGYVGISCFVSNYPELREYVQAILTDTLTGGFRYHIGFYCNAANRLQYAVSTLGAAITMEAPDRVTQDYPNTLLDAEPQIFQQSNTPLTDTANWVLISDTLTALGGERFITIGNFHTDNESDTVRFNPDQPPIGTSPTTSAYYYIDSVFVREIGRAPNSLAELDRDKDKGFLIYPNPTTGSLTIVSTIEEGQPATFEAFNLLGQNVFSQPLIKGETHAVDVSGLMQGIYTARVTVNDKMRYSSKLSVLD